MVRFLPLARSEVCAPTTAFITGGLEVAGSSGGAEGEVCEE